MTEGSWHEDDDFWQSTAPFMFNEESWEDAPAQVDDLLTLLDLAPGSHILDCACGPGRHSLELARRGFKVTGIDRTRHYLSLARRQAETEGLPLELVLEDMRTFNRPDTFDAALSMFTSFGYFDDPAENLQVLLNLHRSLKDDGSLLMELSGKEIIARIYQRRDWREQDGAYRLEERNVAEDWTRMNSRWIVVKDGAVREYSFSHWMYSAGELGALLGECGFRRIRFYGDTAGAPYDHEARRLVAVARK